MSFAPEPARTHDQADITAILLCNLGTPDAPTSSAVRRFLAEFLGDPRVVEIPRLLWWLILHGVILRVRPKRSATRYASIWTPDGSPLIAWTDRLAKSLAGNLGDRGHRVTVRMAMRYGAPAIPTVLDELKAAGATRVLVLPLYPQYAASTTASVTDAVLAWCGRTRVLPELRFVNRFHDDPGYIAALASRIAAHWAAHGQPDKLLMSFHGIPKRSLTLGDPYHCECLKTARLVSEQLGIPANDYLVTFQSRLGRAEWLQPYTEHTLVTLAQQGVRRVDVVCPGFTSDNLETLEEIDQEARAAFLGAGGAEFHYIPCLNDRPDWVRALTSIAEQHLLGWDTRGGPDAHELARRRQRAVDGGARA